MHKIQLIEPQWWLNIIQKWLELQNQYPWIANFAPIWADIFVLIYPIILLSIYIYDIIKKKTEWKIAALFIFISTFTSTICNIWIQTFFIKDRPIIALQWIETEETLLHWILPASSFPSDHAVVSMSFAIATLAWWIAYKKKSYIYTWISLIIISFIMTSCRILTLVHRPSDILWWICLGALIPCVLIIKPIREFIIKHLINPIINMEKRIMLKIFKYRQ